MDTKDMLFIKMEGRIDSNNAADFLEEATKEIENSLCRMVVLDAKNLEYISSAGLRSVLSLKKKYDNVDIINANDVVYEIFETTGFTSMMSIYRVLKEFSVEGCEIVGKGAKGTVYRYGAESVIKVYNSKNSIEDIKLEMELAKKAFIAGLPTAISYGIVRVGDRLGAYFELVDADFIAHLIKENPGKLDEYAGILARLMIQIHETEVSYMNLPNASDYALNWINTGLRHVDEHKADMLCEMINALPHRSTMIHGDFHANNVLLQNGEAIMIDMDRVAMGHPIIELGGMYLFYIAYGVDDPSIVENFLGIPYETSCELYGRILKVYLGNAADKDIETVMDKAALLGYARLLSHIYKKGTDISEESERLRDLYMEKIDYYLKRVKTLDF